MNRHIFTPNTLANTPRVDFVGNITAGEIRSRKARDRIRRWAELHREQLEANWEKMKTGQPLESIQPLSEERS
jgi:Domain of unknown function (DUF4160)